MSNPFSHNTGGFPNDLSGTFAGFPSSSSRSYHITIGGTNAQPHYSQGHLSHLLNPSYDTASSDLYAAPASSFQTHAMEGNEHSSSAPDPSPSGMPRTQQLPSFSRAFEMFVGGEGSQSPWPTIPRNTGFFTPSYLAKTKYIERLEEARKTKAAHREGQQQVTGPGPGQLDDQTDSPSILPKPASHLGMTFDLIERAPFDEAEDRVAPLPTRWNQDDKFGGLEVMGDGLEVKYTGSKPPGEREHEACAIRADHAMPCEAGIYYFEVEIMSRKRDDSAICVGYTQKAVPLMRLPGWENDSLGYHGDDGHVYAGHSTEKSYGPPFTTGDVVGCGVNFKTRTAFFTKGGKWYGTACTEVKGKLYPAIGLKKPGDHIRANFGQSPFVFDIDHMMRQQRDEIEHSIGETSIENLVTPPVNEAELIQNLVLQFLQHDGYVETAKAFAEEMHSEKQALSFDSDAPVPPYSIKDDEDANRRQRIRRAILEGDIDKALKYTWAYYPNVLKEHEQVYFRLRCRKFVEMIRKHAESSKSGKNNGHSSDGTPMDIDENGDAAEKMETEDGLDTSSEDAHQLLMEAIQYGQQLNDEFKDDTRSEVKGALKDVFALVAYPNPFAVEGAAHLLDKRGRATVAEELNSAILMSLGKSSRSALENLYGQTSVLLDYLRDDGGPGCFVDVQDVRN